MRLAGDVSPVWLKSPLRYTEPGRIDNVLADKGGVLMGRNIIVGMTAVAVFFSAVSSYAQETWVEERTPVLREAKQDAQTTLAIDAYLIGDVLEVRVTARMYAAKPEISNIILVGPKIGRLSPQTKRTVTSSVEDEAPYPMSKRGAFINFGSKTRTGKGRGTLTREQVEFKLPADKIMPQRVYQIWVRVKSAQSGGTVHGFKFDLKDFAGLVAKQR